MEENQGTDTLMKKNSLAKMSLVVLVVFVGLVIYVFNTVKNNKKGQVVFPAGVNYVGPGGQAETQPLYDYTKLLSSSDWKTYKGKTFAYSFQYPKELLPLVFANDPTDAVTFKMGTIIPEHNLMLVVETIENRDKTLVGKQEEFVRTYWKYFGGLKGLSSIKQFTNEQGLTGYKAVYATKTGSFTTERIFFVIPNDPSHMIYLANIFVPGGEVFFDRVVNSFQYGVK